MIPFAVRPLTDADRVWLAAFVAQRWGSTLMVVRETLVDMTTLPGLVALDGETVVGLITYRLDGDDAEVMSLDSLREGEGIGSTLLQAVIDTARAANCSRLRLVTTNDNLHALRFYQRRGFRPAALRPDAVTRARRLKSEIPLLGNDGIPLRDEIELDIRL